MTAYLKGSRGLEITRLEIALQELGLYKAALDDIFGTGLEHAVVAYQRMRGLPATGTADERTAAMILAEPSPVAAPLTGKATAYRSLSLTAGFETSTAAPDCFSGLAGDFDGQGISFGVLQWNLGQGTLQRLLKALDAEHARVVAEAFGDGYAILLSMLRKSPADQLAWARMIQGPRKRSLAEPWRSRFQALGRTLECQEAQVREAGALFARAGGLCREYGLWSERGLALMFDIVVQNGSIRSATRDRILLEFGSIDSSAPAETQEVERMAIIANRRAEAARPEYVEDVRRRKLAIANGTGIVHGRGYDLGRQYLIDLTPAEAVQPMPIPVPG